MSDNLSNAQLLDLFRAYLETASPEGVSAQLNDEQRQTDLFSLFTELAALKNEVKLESRQVKTALDQFKELFTMLGDSHDELKQELERSRTVHNDLRRNTLQLLLLELLELLDRMEAGLKVFANRRRSPRAWAWLYRRETALIEALKQGQEISLRRLQQLLQQHDVTTIEALGKTLDPHTMRATEVENRHDIDNGIVTEELRKGYAWSGELLRAAEVKVNRQPE